MSLRTKMFLGIMVTMLGITTVLTIYLVYASLQHQELFKDDAREHIRRLVNTWVETTFPDTLDEERLREPLRAYAERFTGENGQVGVFREIVLVDRHLRVVDRFAAEGLDDEDTDADGIATPPQSVFPSAPVGGLLFDEHLMEVIRDPVASLVDYEHLVVYRPLVRELPAFCSALNLPAAFRDRLPAEGQRAAFALRLRLNLSLESPMADEDLISQVLKIMIVGMVVMILVIYLLLQHLVLRQLDPLARLSRILAKGQYEEITLPESHSHDEIGELHTAFGGMVREVVESRKNLEQRVEQAVNEQRKAERGLMIAQRLAATGTLAAGIAHEINNPISGMQNAVRRLEKRFGEKMDRRGREYLDLLKEGLARVEEIVKQVLQYSRRKPNPEPFDLSEPIERAIAFTSHKARRLKVEVQAAPPPRDAQVPTTFADRGEIQQVFTNLMINALDAIRKARETDPEHAADADAITIRWGAVQREHDVTVIQATITDTGCGMSEEEALRAFDAFYTTKEEGTGLGLAIVHSIIDSHGGTIHLDSEIGKGTTVTIELLPAELDDLPPS